MSSVESLGFCHTLEALLLRLQSYHSPYPQRLPLVFLQSQPNTLPTCELFPLAGITSHLLRGIADFVSAAATAATTMSLKVTSFFSGTIMFEDAVPGICGYFSSPLVLLLQVLHYHSTQDHFFLLQPSNFQRHCLWYLLIFSSLLSPPRSFCPTASGASARLMTTAPCSTPNRGRCRSRRCH
ncbi:hypothetical protein BGX38DRAFT_365796 [Terfezia claveryi]|nr:hypothetical protein BGX38DRAFT_365796 [Terfezia claveryi]